MPAMIPVPAEAWGRGAGGKVAQTDASGTVTAASATPARERWYKVLYTRVLIAIALGVVIGYAAPEASRSFRWKGDAFVAQIPMMIASIIFCIIVHGIVSNGEFKKLRRVGLKTLLDFELMWMLALVIVGEAASPPWPSAAVRANLTRHSYAR